MAVAPLRLVTHRESLYLLARREQDLAKTNDFFEPRLAVQRIESAAMTVRTFTPPATKIDHGGHFGFMPGKPFRVVVEAEARVAPYIRARVWHASQQISDAEEGGLRVTMNVCHDWALRSWLLSWGAFARVISPAGLAAEIKSDLQSAAARYGRASRNGASRS